MGDINERLDRLKLKIQTEDFLWGKGLSNEVNIWIFCYEPTEEMTVHNFVEGLIVEQNLKCRVHNFNLYEVFLDICRKKNILSKIPAMEEKKGKDYLLRQMHSITTESAFINQINFEPQTRGTDMILLSGVGDVFPFMRVHSLLEAMQPHFSNMPILVLYPGKFEDAQLKLFNKLKPNSYYRAFNII